MKLRVIKDGPREPGGVCVDRVGKTGRCALVQESWGQLQNMHLTQADQRLFWRAVSGPHQRWFCPQGTLDNFWRHFCLSEGWGRCYWLHGALARDTAMHLTMHRTTPTTKNYPTQMSVVPRLRMPTLGGLKGEVLQSGKQFRGQYGCSVLWPMPWYGSSWQHPPSICCSRAEWNQWSLDGPGLALITYPSG